MIKKFEDFINENLFDKNNDWDKKKFDWEKEKKKHSFITQTSPKSPGILNIIMSNIHKDDVEPIYDTIINSKFYTDYIERDDSIRVIINFIEEKNIQPIEVDLNNRDEFVNSILKSIDNFGSVSDRTDIGKYFDKYEKQSIILVGDEYILHDIELRKYKGLIKHSLLITYSNEELKNIDKNILSCFDDIEYIR